MNRKTKGVWSIILSFALVALLGYANLAGFGKTHTGSMKNIILGLDLEGGVSITYEADKKSPTEEEMADTVYKLQQRVENYSTEAQVYKEGKNRINIEIPGVSDANTVLEELGKPGSLYFIEHLNAKGEENYTYTKEGVKLSKPIEELKKEKGILLSGTDVKTAKPNEYDNSQTGEHQCVVDLELTKKGAKKFSEATARAVARGNDTIGIYYDNGFVSVPAVQSVISDGRAQISGMENFKGAEELASTIRIGGLKLNLHEIRSNVVGAQLGEEAIETSLKAGAVGLALVCIFMCIVYLLPGLASSLALLIYTGLVLISLNAFDMTLTLPGIAGIILSIGMAVDANVIIFARVREELQAGRSVRVSLKTGFKKALSAIVDGNVTTLIAAIVLGLKGSGPVKGFAETLALGIVLSMFTALLITRMIIWGFYNAGLSDKKYYYKEMKQRKTFDFVGHRKTFFIISLCLILVGPVAIGVNSSNGKGAFNYSLDFKGGTSTTVEFDKNYSLEEIDKNIIPVIEKIADDKNVQQQKVKDTNKVVFKTKTLSLKQREKLNATLEKEFGAKKDSITAENISSTVSKEMRNDAISAVILATIFMLIYIWIRFKDVRFATSAVLALLHDVLVVVAFYALARVSVGTTFIACVLTVVGYSINATIVIFDRVREEMHGMTHKDSLADIVNDSILSTLTRSIYTSLTTFIMVLVLYIMGVSSIKEFALPLMAGIICGAYSSVCITGPLWYVFKTKVGKNRL